MKTDSIFFEIFKRIPGILFELIDESAELGNNYDFRSEEVKQTAFRIDGVFVPKPGAQEQTIIFVEVQFQSDDFLYDRMFSEIGMYLQQNRNVCDWRAVAIFARRSMAPQNQQRHRSFLQGEQFQAVYLEDSLKLDTEKLGIQLMQLIISPPKKTGRYLERIINQIENQPKENAEGKTDLQTQAIIELVNTIMVYKFPTLSREAIEAMFTVSDLKQTKVYQEALEEGRGEGREEGREEGRMEGEITLLLRQLTRRFGAIAPNTEAQIRGLELSQVEELGEALLEFGTDSDLEHWLTEQVSE